jgi:hypothetical protein
MAPSPSTRLVRYAELRTFRRNGAFRNPTHFRRALGRGQKTVLKGKMVGVARIELATPAMSNICAPSRLEGRRHFYLATNPGWSPQIPANPGSSVQGEQGALVRNPAAHLNGIGNSSGRTHLFVMPTKPHRCFIHHPYGPPQPVDQLRFAVVNDDHRIISAVWSMFPHSNMRRCDAFVTAHWSRGSQKFSFHADVLNHSWLHEAHPKLVAEGIAPAGSRHQQQLTIPGLPWHGLTLRFPENLLSKKGEAPDDFDGTIVALPPPRPGHVLDIGFILATGRGLNINGAQFAIGEVSTGGRSLLAVGRYVAQDIEASKAELNTMLARLPVSDHLQAKVGPDDQLVMHLHGMENGVMVVTEAHNVRMVPASNEQTGEGNG